MIDQQFPVGSADRPGEVRRNLADRPPPRPPVISHVPFPGAPPVAPPPRAALVAAWLWGTGCLAGVVGLAVSAVDRAALWDGLTAAARHADPGATGRVVDQGVAITLTAAASGTALLLVVSGWSLVRFFRGRAGARWVMGAAALLTVPMAAVDQGLVRGGLAVDRQAFLVQAGFAVLGSAALLTRSVRSWSGRSRR